MCEPVYLPKLTRKGKENIRDSGLVGLTDAEVSAGAKDKSIPKSERERYKKEDKARKERNKKKRRELY